MKTSKKNLKLVLPVEEDFTSVVRVNNISGHAVLINFLPILSMLFAMLPSILRRSSGTETIKIGLLTLILTTTATFFVRMNAETILNKKFAKSIISISYLGSICLLMLVHNAEIISFWMIGGLLVSMLIDSKLGLLLHFNLSFILVISFSLRPETVIYLLIIGVMMSLLSTSLRQKSTVIYAAIILLSTNITLAFVINNFVFDSSTNYNYLSSFFSIFAVLVAAFLLCLIYDRFTLNMMSKGQVETTEEGKTIEEGKTTAEGKTTEDVKFNSEDSTLNNNCRLEEIEPLKEANPISEEKPSEDNSLNDWKPSSQNHIGTRTSYEVLNEEGNTLLVKLKDISEKLYEHAIHIGAISYRAAKVIGADENLARAGGLYHEIGKINGKNYIEEGIRIAEEYAFPKELTLILKQHNINYEKPTSVEATIVMLSDNVVSTIEYIDQTGDVRFTTDKIIDNIFKMRMDKGTFDNSGLSVKDFKQLKIFYQEEFDQNNRYIKIK